MFTMGSPEGVDDSDEHPPRRVTLPTAWLRRTEVTLDEYRAFLAKADPFDLKVVLAGCSHLDPSRIAVKGEAKESESSLLARAREIAGLAGCPANSLQVDRRPRGEIVMTKRCGEMNGRSGDHPVVCVNQEEAEAFCASEGATLPSEALIESASRGPSGTDEYGNPIEAAAVLRGWAAFGEDLGTQPVCGLKNEREGPFGACDLAGNVMERTSTEYVEDFYPTMPAYNPDNPATVESEHVVLRGGSYFLGKWNARAADRAFDDPAYRSSNVGFRCARLQPPDSPEK
jgi:formylglycine-generating enzyme required for sulfatase activity